MKKIIWIDVGTHFAQEHTSLFGPNLSFYLHILKRFIGGKLLRRGKFVGLKDLRNIVSLRSKIRKREKYFFTVFIEANPKIFFRKKNYLNASLAFNLALRLHSLILNGDNTPTRETFLMFKRSRRSINSETF